jgi:hypothetical protein
MPIPIREIRVIRGYKTCTAELETIDLQNV